MMRSFLHHDRLIAGFQFALLAGFLTFIAAIITWIVHLVRLSFLLEDAPSVAVGISMVAVPVFSVLAGVVTYLIIGLVLDPEARDLGTPEEGDQ